MKALIAMSGGVDSGVAAFLTAQTGAECIGCTMKLHDFSAGEGICGAADDIADAKAIAEKLGMPHYVFDFSDAFREHVIENFVDCYRCGRTPNPCIECNRHMKFAGLLKKAETLGCDRIVTGHYVQIAETPDGLMLRRAADAGKDQSYVLYMLTQEQLAHIAFPLGGLTKQRVREIAEEQGFSNAHKRDSQDICFVPDGDYARVIESLTGEHAVPGDFTDTAGNVIGRHRGLIHYTIGQRRGLGIALGKPAYVCGLDVPHNRVVIGDNADLFRDTCEIGSACWTAGAPPQEPVRCEAKIRYRHPAQPAVLTFTDDRKAVLRFDQPQRAITPGQTAVFYRDDLVLGGGEILTVL